MTALLKIIVKFIITASAVMIINSCATTKTIQDQYQEAEVHFSSGNYTEAARVIESYREISYKEKDRVLFYLDSGMLYHYSGEYEKSNQALTLAEQGIEDLYTKSISKAIGSGLLNDNTLDYSGEDYEDIYINIFKALNYIALGNKDNALVEIRRVNIKLNILEDKYREIIENYNSSDNPEGKIIARKNRFHNNALSRYLGLLLYRADKSYDDARIEGDEINKAFQFQSHLYNFSQPEIPALRKEKDKAFLSVVAFSGNSPRKLAETFYLHTTKNVVWIAATSQDTDYVNNVVGFNNIYMMGVEEGFHFKFQYPKMHLMGSTVDRIELEIDGVVVRELSLIEEMEKISQEIYLLKQPLVVGKTVIRAVIKNILKEKAKEKAEEKLAGGNSFLGAIMGLAADVAVDATENADLRISPYFPAKAAVTDLAVTPGEHSVSIVYYSGGTAVFRDDKGTVNMNPDGLNIIESFLLK